jgi:hypothetical protein
MDWTTVLVAGVTGGVGVFGILQTNKTSRRHLEFEEERLKEEHRRYLIDKRGETYRALMQHCYEWTYWMETTLPLIGKWHEPTGFPSVESQIASQVEVILYGSAAVGELIPELGRVMREFTDAAQMVWMEKQGGLPSQSSDATALKNCREEMGELIGRLKVLVASELQGALHY